MFKEILTIIYNILKSDLLFIVIDIILANFMTISAILVYNKTKKIVYLLFILTSFMIYLNMIFRVLEILQVFVLKEFLINDIPIFYYILNFSISLFFGIGFLLLIFEKK